MIKARILFDENREYVGFHISGHAGYEKAGKDIICAGVSMLVYTFASSIMHLVEDRYVSEINEDSAIFRFRFKEVPSKEGKLLFQSFLLGLEMMEDSYGLPYIQLLYYQKSDGKFIKTNYQEV